MIAGSLSFLKLDFSGLKSAVNKALGPAEKTVPKDYDKRSESRNTDDEDRLFSESFFWGTYPYY